MLISHPTPFTKYLQFRYDQQKEVKMIKLFKIKERHMGNITNLYGQAPSINRSAGELRLYKDKGYAVGNGSEGMDKFMGKAVNASIVLGIGTLAVTKLLTIDHEYWHGWTLYEILRYAPEHNWIAYKEALKENPVLAKMMISGVVYSIGDWIAQVISSLYNFFSNFFFSTCFFPVSIVFKWFS
ncbi:hypothetical protein LXL04_016118 [Taraxacum kok-saghyz]